MNTTFSLPQQPAGKLPNATPSAPLINPAILKLREENEKRQQDQQLLKIYGLIVGGAGALTGILGMAAYSLISYQTRCNIEEGRRLAYMNSFPSPLVPEASLQPVSSTTPTKGAEPKVAPSKKTQEKPATKATEKKSPLKAKEANLAAKTAEFAPNRTFFQKVISLFVADSVLETAFPLETPVVPEDFSLVELPLVPVNSLDDPIEPFSAFHDPAFPETQIQNPELNRGPDCKSYENSEVGSEIWNDPIDVTENSQPSLELIQNSPSSKKAALVAAIAITAVGSYVATQYLIPLVRDLFKREEIQQELKAEMDQLGKSV